MKNLQKVIEKEVGSLDISKMAKNIKRYESLQLLAAAIRPIHMDERTDSNVAASVRSVADKIVQCFSGDGKEWKNSDTYTEFEKEVAVFNLFRNVLTPKGSKDFTALMFTRSRKIYKEIIQNIQDKQKCDELQTRKKDKDQEDPTEARKPFDTAKDSLSAFWKTHLAGNVLTAAVDYVKKVRTVNLARAHINHKSYALIPSNVQITMNPGMI